MFEINLYRIGKKLNSTRLPSGTPLSLQCLAKSKLDIINPIIYISHSNPTEFNYARIEILDRYYFINKWSYSEGLWYAELNVDVLASFKSGIGGNNEYIIRSSNSYNLDLVDNFYPTKSATAIVRDTIDSDWDIANGSYIVTIIGQGLSTHYLIYEDDLNGLFRYLFSDDYLDALYPSWHTLMPELRTQVNPLQYISSIKWIPFRVTFSNIVTQIPVGYVMCPCDAMLIPANSIRTIVDNFTLQRHPQESRGRYLNKSPYTTYTLFYPPFGLIELDSDIMANSSTLRLAVEVDMRVGKATLTVSVDEDFNRFKVVTWLHSDLSVEVEFSQIVRSAPSMLSVIKPITQLLALNPVGSITASIGAIGDGTSAMTPSAKSYGSDGARNSFGNSITMIYTFKEIAQEDLANNGRPLCERRNIGNTGGYMIIDKPIPVITGATENELNMIIDFMKGGFYYE